MPECYADTLLIETLVPTNQGYNHKHSCFKVEQEMKHGKFKEQFAVGIIDNDKAQIAYLKEFIKIDEVEGSLILWKHAEKDHFIVQICPALEKWVLNICGAANIELTGLGNSLEQFKKYTKAKTSLHDVFLKNLFSEISQMDDLVEVRKLKGWITQLKEKNYQVDINELKNV